MVWGGGWGGLDADASFVFVGDSFGYGETESGAFESLCGVEGFEDPGESVLGDSWAVIDDGDDDGWAEDMSGVFLVGS